MEPILVTCLIVAVVVIIYRNTGKKTDGVMGVAPSVPSQGNSATGVPDKGRRITSLYIIIGLLIAFGPLLVSLIASIPGEFICTEKAGAYDKCSVFGINVTGLFNALILLHWFAIYTFIPGIAIACIGPFAARRAKNG